jgi:stage II sporulation protein D
MLRRLILVFSIAVAPVAGAATAARAAPACTSTCFSAPAGSGPLFLVSGHGWGHGVGMSQYGAYGYAQHGATYQQILAH